MQGQDVAVLLSATPPDRIRDAPGASEPTGFNMAQGITPFPRIVVLQ